MTRRLEHGAFYRSIDAAQRELARRQFWARILFWRKRRPIKATAMAASGRSGYVTTVTVSPGPQRPSPALLERIASKVRRAIRPEPRQHLYLVQSPAADEGWIDGPNGHTIYASSFNPMWLNELGVVPLTVLDVGSYDGGDAYRFKRLYPAARVLTIEADPARAALVREALSGVDVTVIEAAVTSRDGEVNFYPTTDETGASAQGSVLKMSAKGRQELPHIRQADTPVTLPARSLESLSREHALAGIDLVHMDIQGGEYDAILGLGELRPKILYLEVRSDYDGTKSPESIHRLLTGMGYKMAADLVSDRLYVFQS